MEWTIFHRYRHLVSEGKTKAILCPDCQEPLVTRIKGENDDPHFWCADHGFTTPGLRVYDQMKNVVAEHYME